MNYSKLIVCFFITIIVVSCKSDTTIIDKKDIVANWKIIDAKRNGASTSTLENAIFYISENEIIHNLNGDTITSSYIIDNNEMAIQDDLIESMEIIQVTADSLITKTKIQDFKFDFIMVKNE